jgi:2-oxoglutarate dehydrogenase E1 component
MSQSLKARYAWSPLFGSNAPYVEELYEEFRADPASVPENWRAFFDKIGDDGAPAMGAVTTASHAEVRRSLTDRTRPAGAPGATQPVGPTAASEKQAAVSRLIQIYGLRGHQIADLDPLKLTERPVPAVFKLDFLGLSDADMDTEFYTGGLAGTGHGKMRLSQIIETLKTVYCGRVGADFAHLSRGRERMTR